MQIIQKILLLSIRKSKDFLAVFSTFVNNSLVLRFESRVED